MTQEEIIKKAYEVYPETYAFNPENRTHYDENEKERDAYIKGLTEQLDCPKIKGWVARDGDGELWLHSQKPLRRGRGNDSEWFGMGFFKLGDGIFPNLRWEDEPLEVELLIQGVK